ncbi:MAG TPA: Mth938-like domain-containing protein [Anaerohalosphaeraceae bacterium]|jgi:hypothetical protein|nr:Mth938-like domain-containing protein [Anaerohalosphaeraceae bacterium]HRT49299.1 Mth938-like domain-containing protein [Anaerohalosphaeraceae bacterium]HRT85162.1 Mth938-like domain-containing protein [Anaerohalosphaeraceae bacterium]
MKIEAYESGEMTIEGSRFTDDLLVYPDHVTPKWWRRVGHRLEPEDLAEVFDARPEVIVVGMGQSGMMKIPDLTRETLNEQGIELVAEETDKAWPLYNRLADEGRRVVGAFHLTC